MLKSIRKSKKGFTLAETMAAVAVLIILMGIISIPVIRLIKDFQQTKRDNMAKTIYVHAQNNLTKLTAEGRLYEVKNLEEPGQAIVKEMPSDFDINTVADGTYIDDELSAITYGYAKKDYFVANDAIDANGRYVIEYNERTGDVYSVFYYVEDKYDDTTPEFYDNNAGTIINELRLNREARKDYEVGYYGGHMREDIEKETNKIISNIVVDNGEVLTANFIINMPIGNQREDDKIDFTIMIKGLTSEKEYPVHHTTGGSYEKGLEFVGAVGATETDAVRKYSLVLDKLDDSNNSFANKFVKNNGFIEGENISIEIVVQDLDNPDVASSKLDPKVISSLFEELREDKLGNVYADISCVRHLQNLNNFDSTKVKKEDGTTLIDQLIANQTNDLDLNNSKPGEYRDVYGDRKFVAIDKNIIYKYEGNDYYISNLDIRSGNSNGGLFANFYGKELANMILINTKASGANAGAIAGAIVNKAGQTQVAPVVNINNCRVYLDSTLYSGKLAENNLYINASTGAAGGLVGVVTDTALNVTDSFASTTIVGSTYAGGLVGNTTQNVTVSKSYTSSYIKSTLTTGAAGGMAGNVGNGSTFDSCYTAGYLLGGCGKVAGFVPSNVASVSNSYSIFFTHGAIVSSNYAIVSEAASMSNVFYENKDALNPGNKATRIKLDNTQTDDTKGLDNLRVIANRLGGNFVNNNSGIKSTPYRMSNLAAALERYPYPTLTNTKGKESDPHYDVTSNHYGDWYEVVDINGQLAYFEVYTDGTAGFFTPGVSTLAESKTVSYDGYCLIFKGTDVAGAGFNTLVTFYGNGEDKAPTYNANIGGEYKEFDANDGKSYLYKIIPSEIIQSAPIKDKYYQKLQTNNDPDFIYYFNPSYAKTVATVNGDTPELISIRTARHVNHLSKNYNSQLTNIGNSIFNQEKDVNYNTYNWSEAGYRKVTNQNSIGDINNKFISTYNGNCYKITGLNVNVGSSSKYAGMFGYASSDAKINNVVLSNEYESAANIAMNLTSGNGYVGSLVAYNDGEIENCAADGYKFDVRNVSNATVNVGGLVGVNNGYITKCSSDIPEINVSSTAADAYIGGFAGRNNSSIRYSYALGYINANKQASGNVRVGGFTTTNSSISYAYAATAINTNDSSINVAGFADNGGFYTFARYLNDDSEIFDYAGNKYRFIFDESKTIGSSMLYSDLSNPDFNINGFGTVVNSYDHAATNSSEGYPFKGSVVDAGNNFVHYGDWPTVTTAGDIGFYYWELEGSEYHYHILSSKRGSSDVEYSNICTDYKCRDNITDFGYGYYIKNEYITDTPEWGNLVSTEYTKQDRNTAASDAIANATGAAKDRYTFYSLYSGANGLCPNTYDASTLDINVNKVKYYYEFAPLFGDSFSTTRLTEYKVRNFTQLQNINWNSTTRNATTIDDGTRAAQYLYIDIGSNPSKPKPSIKQTHNVMGENRSFVPIGASTKLYAYDGLGFVGTYDGQTYEINDIKMEYGDVKNIGLFAYVTDATLKNIVLFSPDGTGVITKSGANMVRTSGSTRGYYTIAGIVGYMNGNSAISNSCVAGYTITDNVNENYRDGCEVYIGGVVGAAKSKMSSNKTQSTINNCSSFVTINANTTATGNNMGAGWTHVQVGGIAGGAPVVNNCFSGGSIKAETGKAAAFSSGNTARFFLSGIVAGCDFTHLLRTTMDDDVVANNCYTFMSSISYTGSCVNEVGKVAIDDASEINYDTKITNSYTSSDTSYQKTPDDNSTVKAKSYNDMSANSFVTTMGSQFGRASVSNCISDILEGTSFPYPTSIKRGNSYVYYGDWTFVNNRLIAAPSNLYLDLFTVSDGVRDSIKTSDIENYDNINSRAPISSKPTYIFESTGTTESDLVDIELTDNGGSPNSYKLTAKSKGIVGNDTIVLSYDGKNVSVPISVEGSSYLSMTSDKDEVFEKEITGIENANIINYVIELANDKGDNQLIDYLNPQNWSVTDEYGGPVSNLKSNIIFVDANGNPTVDAEGEPIAVVNRITSGPNAGKYSLYVKAVENPSTDKERNVKFKITANIPVNDYVVDQPKDGQIVSLRILPVVNNVSIMYYPYVGFAATDENSLYSLKPSFNEEIKSTYTITEEQCDGRHFVKWVDEDGKDFAPSTEHPINVRKSYKLFAVYDYYTINLWDALGGSAILNNTIYKSTISDQYYSAKELSDESKLTVTEGETTTTTIPIPTREDCEFRGCFSQDGSVMFANETGVVQPDVTITGDSDFYINWFTNIHLINFYEDDNTNVPIPDVFKEFKTGTNELSEETALPKVSVDSHHDFDGWKIKGSTNEENKTLFDKDGNLLKLAGYYEDVQQEGSLIKKPIWTAETNILLSPRLIQSDTLITLLPGDHAKASSQPITNVWGVVGQSGVSLDSSVIHQAADGYILLGYGYEKDDGTPVVVIDDTLVFQKSTAYTDANGRFNYTGKTLELKGLYKAYEGTLKFNASFNNYTSTTATISNGKLATDLITDRGVTLGGLVYNQERVGFGWKLDGWYYHKDSKYYKVIDYADDGSYRFVEGSGLVADGKFIGIETPRQTIELRAVWKKQPGVLFEYIKEVVDYEAENMKFGANDQYLLLPVYTEPNTHSITTIDANNSGKFATVTLSPSIRNDSIIHTDWNYTPESSGTNAPLVKLDAGRTYIAENYQDYAWSFVKNGNVFNMYQTIGSKKYYLNIRQVGLHGEQSIGSATPLEYKSSTPYIQKTTAFEYYLNPSDDRTTTLSPYKVYLFKKIDVNTVNRTSKGEYTIEEKDRIIYDMD